MTASRIAAKPTGLPRPLMPDANGTQRPIPWSQSDDRRVDAWGVLDDEASQHGTEESLCLVCGERVERGQVIRSNPFATLDPYEQTALMRRRVFRKDDLRRSYIADNGPLHDRCMKITIAHCKSVRTRIVDGTLKPMPYRA